MVLRADKVLMFDEEELNQFYQYHIALTGNEEDAFDLQ